ncbi:DUF3389 family protein [Shewanella algae]|uniref:DUF3389 family protein n=1 Tax=Shewanella algae TaxID=38313 RepID=UPI001AADAF47|nr:DUF3389 family protein [Shewanella algae]MBO2615972.1 DUF3389 family protein [Shewanella algae]
MKIDCEQGRLLLSPNELQARLPAMQTVLMALSDDIRLLKGPCILLADAGAVRWQLRLDSDEQLEQLADFYGLTPE